MDKLHLVAIELDRLRATPSPCVDDATRLIRLMDRGSAAAYFFRDAFSNTTWLAPLANASAFHKYSRVRTAKRARWMICRELAGYLARVAGSQPDQVKSILAGLSARDPFVVGSFVKALLGMPARVARDLLPQLKKWLRVPEAQWFREDLASLMSSFSRAQHGEEALAIAAIILQPQTGSGGTGVTGAFYDQDLYEFVHGALQDVSASHPEQTLELVERMLRRAIALRNRASLESWRRAVETIEDQDARQAALARATTSKADTSYVWRPAIEESSRNEVMYYESALVDAARQALLHMIGDDPSAAETLLAKRLNSRMSIFRRLALHALCEKYEQFRNLATNVASQERFLRDVHARHEYARLLQRAFDDFSDEERRVVADRIVRRSKRYPWEMLELLYVLRDKQLTHSARRRLLRLQGRFGTPDEPGFHTHFWVGPESPCKLEDLRQQSPEALLDYLQTWEPPSEPERPYGPSREGLGRAVSALVTEDPDTYLALASRIDSVHPIYVRDYVLGLTQAVRQGKVIDWQPVVDLADRLVPDTPPETWPDSAPPADDKTDANYGLRGTREGIADLLEEGLLPREPRPEERRISTSLLPNVRQILLRLVRDTYPTRDEEDRYASRHAQTSREPPDWTGYAINTARGQATHSLIKYAWRRAWDSREGTGQAPTALEADVREALDTLLRDQCRSVRSVFGFWLWLLHRLDVGWTESRLERILPHDEADNEIWEASWLAFLHYSRGMSEPLYEVLRQDYRRAIRCVALAQDGRLLKGLASHLANAYLLTWEALETPGSLIGKFLDTTEDGARSELAESLARELGGMGQEPERMSEYWPRFRAFLEHRVNSAAVDPGAHSKELMALASWCRELPAGELGRLGELGEPLRVVACAPMFQHGVQPLLEYLSRDASADPAVATAIAVSVLRKSPRESWLWQDQEIGRILGVAFASGGQKAQRQAVRMIEVLWDAGLWRFYDSHRDEVARLAEA